MAAQSVQIKLTDRDLPKLYQQSDKASKDAQTLFFRLLGSELILLTLGAIVGLLSGLLSPAPEISVGLIKVFGRTVTSVPAVDLAAGLLILAALVIRLIRFFGHFDAKWYEARAVAETAKSVAWRYAVGGLPFLKDDPQALAPIATRSQDIVRDLNKRWRAEDAAALGQVTETMQALRDQSLSERQRAYLNDRIRNQRDWYKQKQEENHRRALFAHWILVAFEFLGIVFAVLQAFGIVTLNLQTVATAFVSGGIAWTQAQRYEDLSASYGVTAKEAEALEMSSQVTKNVTEAEWAAFVDSAEAVFSREHRLWRAVRTPEPAI